MTLQLYARARNLPLTVLTVTSVSVTTAVLAEHLTAQPRHGEMVRLPLAFVAALTCAVLLTGTLHSPLAELEASTPKPWPRWRLTHATCLIAVGALLLAPALPPGEWGVAVLLRDFAGFTGLALIAAAALGPRLAWTLPCAYGAAGYLTGGTRSSGWHTIWGFATQAWPSPTATATASTLLLLGSFAWTVTPGTRRSDGSLDA